jgi:hypothetical protein
MEVVRVQRTAKALTKGQSAVTRARVLRSFDRHGDNIGRGTALDCPQGDAALPRLPRNQEVSYSLHYSSQPHLHPYPLRICFHCREPAKFIRTLLHRLHMR